MSNGGVQFVRVMKVSDFNPGDPPVDISKIVRETAPGATARILTRIEVNKPDGKEPPPAPAFYSIARKCTHSGCNLLKGGPAWRLVDRPIVFSMLGTDGVAYAVIECPCHGSRFDLTTGERLLEPAPPGPLDRFETKVEDAQEMDDQGNPVVDGAGNPVVAPYVFVAVDPVGQATT